MQDNYTNKTKKWLDERFKSCDENGIYFAHQPIYGFRKGHCEPGLLERYIRTYHIMKMLSHLNFSSFIDIGGAEGYKAYIVNKLFNIKATNCDLSEEACKRTKELFNIESVSVDIHKLPFKNSQFDIVLCSETLEHIVDTSQAINELLRIANKAVLITVPHESKELIDKLIDQGEPHTHIHSFDINSFNFLKDRGYYLHRKKMINFLFRIPGLAAIIIGENQKNYNERTRYPKFLVDIYNNNLPILRKIFAKRTTSFLIYIDEILCKFTSSYNAFLITIFKKNCYQKKTSLDISPLKIMDISVGYHYLNK